jgi:hypothetical protein
MMRPVHRRMSQFEHPNDGLSVLVIGLHENRHIAQIPSILRESEDHRIENAFVLDVVRNHGKETETEN